VSEFGFVVKFTRHSKAAPELLFIREADVSHPNTATFFARVREDGGSYIASTPLVEKLPTGKIVKARDYRRFVHPLGFRPQSAFLR
jgi:hypothetical protein